MEPLLSFTILALRIQIQVGSLTVTTTSLLLFWSASKMYQFTALYTLMKECWFTLTTVSLIDMELLTNLRLALISFSRLSYDESKAFH